MPKDSNSSACFVDLTADVFKNMVITEKRKQGRPAKTVGALRKQPNELQEICSGGILYESDEIAITQAQAVLQAVVVGEPPKRKRGRPPKQVEDSVVAPKVVEPLIVNNTTRSKRSKATD